ncbi:methyltransferase FkbM [Bacillus cereus]|uniref:FkbM family methyltransferase n=1 Tax=Bacillus nitratireducens TaxID=2026193 RepID=UPI000BF77650|nr:FkbM family methyltransferase [Bacillus nitratireducens]PFB91716.1 methyltransferase FkbM [Bacillus cereus]PFI32526.1 methyltransferase FkbM [Bacillus cereus]PGO96512.1 methyltransferase FkbM [Bacillus cereus]PGU28246.1 methyltransferase FkbM [Bacillus cereus]
MSNNVISISKRKAKFDVVVNPRNAAVWDLINKNSWEEHTFNILDKFLNENHNYLDIGAWVGPTVLYGAHLAKHVYAIEPDPVAFEELNENLTLNSPISSKVTPINNALSEKTGTTNLYIRSEYGDSTPSLIPTISDNSCTVDCITIHELINKYNIKDLSFIKIDIEGSEYSLIPSMKEFLELEKTTLYLSLHPPFLRENLHRQYTCRNELEYNYNKINKNLLENLRMYKYIYDAHGNLVNEEVLLNEVNFKEFLFTNECL